MVQGEMFSLHGVIDLGPIDGASGGRKLQVLGEAVYGSKCFLVDRPYTLVNEVVCAELATKLSLPIPARKYIEYQDKVWFGSEWKPEHRTLTEDKLLNLTNKDKIPDLLAFDVFVCNPDRRNANILIQKVSPLLNHYTFFLIDHSHALVGTMQSLHQFLNTTKATNTYLRHDKMLLDMIKSLGDFEGFLRKVESLTEAELDEVVQSVPSAWRPTPDDISLLVPFLVRRKAELRQLLSAAQGCFPNLVQRRMP